MKGMSAKVSTKIRTRLDLSESPSSTGLPTGTTSTSALGFSLRIFSGPPRRSSLPPPATSCCAQSAPVPLACTQQLHPFIINMATNSHKR
uniref:Uncharacterized protein n=1 Tax=Setaria italica TaxID=4555 RepID=K3YNX3_SETIT